MKRRTQKNLTWLPLFSIIIWVFYPSESYASRSAQGSNTHSFSVEDNPYKYSSYYSDSESEMYYLKARYYSPELMRFFTRDTYDLSNKYAYCDGNPIEKVDPSGHSPIPFIFWEIANLAGTVAAAWELGDSINKGDLKMAITSGLVLAVALGSYYACAKAYKLEQLGGGVGGGKAVVPGNKEQRLLSSECKTELYHQEVSTPTQIYNRHETMIKEYLKELEEVGEVSYNDTLFAKMIPSCYSLDQKRQIANVVMNSLKNVSSDTIEYLEIGRSEWGTFELTKKGKVVYHTAELWVKPHEVIRDEENYFLGFVYDCKKNFIEAEVYRTIEETEIFLKNLKSK